MSAIVVDNVVREWPGLKALNGVSFEAEAGQFLVLLGPSGCGKSTLLRLIAGLDFPDEGVVLIGGRNLTYAQPADRNISMVFQSYALFPHLSVAENITFGLQVRKVPAEERQERLKNAANILGLEKLLDRKPSQLSGGQQQRVALGRAIVSGAPVCLMDEPLSNLDAKLRLDMRREIVALQRRLGITMIYVTHDQTEAMTMADKIVLLKDGSIEQFGPPQEIFERPGSVFAARFIGSLPMNIITVDPKGVTAGMARSELVNRVIAESGTAILGVRPDDMRLSESGPVSGEVIDAEYLGGGSVVGCLISGQRLAARVPKGMTLPPIGATVTLDWSTDAEHVFDPKTERRVA